MAATVHEPFVEVNYGAYSFNAPTSMQEAKSIANYITNNTSGDVVAIPVYVTADDNYETWVRDRRCCIATTTAEDTATELAVWAQDNL